MANVSEKWQRENIGERELYLDFVLPVASCAALAFTLLIGTTANLFVIWAVHHQKSLQTPNNALLVSLAVTDLLRSAVDCPLLLAIALHLPGRGDLGTVLCHAQIVSFSLSCCVQLITLACISAERYHAIAHPFESGRRRKRVIILITATWTAAIFISLFSITVAEDTPVYRQCRGTSSDVLPAHNSFGLYILVPLWLSCLAVITGFYGRIFVIVRSHGRKILDDCGLREEEDRKKTKSKITEENPTTASVEPGEGRRAEESVTRSNQEKVVESHKTHVFWSVPTTADHKTEGVRASGMAKHNEKDKQAQPPRPAEEMGSNSIKQLEDLCVPADEQVCTVLQDAMTKHHRKVLPGEKVSEQVISTNTGKVGNEHFLFHADQDRHKHKESQLAKRSGYIVLMFLMFWTPLILSAFASFLTGHNKTSALRVVLQLDFLSISVACMTSASNPVIYAAVNPHFRTEFQKMKAKWKAALCYNSQRTSCC